MTPTHSRPDVVPARHAGALLIVGVRGLEATARELDLLREVRPGGVILFRRNVGSAGQLHALVSSLREAVPDLLLYSDSEGGRVDRLGRVAGGAPAGRDLAAAAPELARESGRWIGESLRLFGFDVDFAPVVDLDRGEEKNALDTRYLGASPEAVIARARAFLDGLHAAGVGGCLKHYPGLGSTEGDTHLGVGRSDLGLAELAPDGSPFGALAGVARSVMISHAIFPSLDPEKRPASLSPPLYRRLRRHLGPDVLVVSDDLEMGALSAWGDLSERSASCLAAGCDLLALCHSLEEIPAVAERLAEDDLAPRRAEALERLAAWRRHLAELAGRAGERADLELVRTRLAGLREHRPADHSGTDPTEAVDPTAFDRRT